MEEEQPNTAAYELISALNPDADQETMRILENLNPADRSLFSLLVCSPGGLCATDPTALKTFFKYIQAGRALSDSLSMAPIQQVHATKTLVRVWHAGLEREMAEIEDPTY
ncbi:hypothetical protein N7539_008959 [Penicillium diatomitis]|uniref:Uncharacterized protein n=1 Tax=Penicillium diatomitis TaxID=2819901 RepID=A0A9X0BJ89_9EURO|nr:uncharacterized protein N7539_008959 [Penicillium diatomitis]KAJ5469341.1 hypothetical protein N7539_008959 [Penicillium diatomitis]